jgi:hypothetical protein
VLDGTAPVPPVPPVPRTSLAYLEAGAYSDGQTSTFDRPKGLLMRRVEGWQWDHQPQPRNPASSMAHRAAYHVVRTEG